MKLTLKKSLIVMGTLVALVVSAAALSILFTLHGTVASYDFGGFGPGHPVPGTVEIQAFNMKPGDVIPWHYHKGLTYVILARGNVTEQDVEGPGPNDCGPINLDAAGTAFVEPPGRIHTLTNPGPGAATIYFATIFPKDDPDGDAKFVDPPNCN